MTYSFVIDDSTDLNQFLIDNDGRCGCKPRSEYTGPVCASAPAEDEELIPWEAMPDKIADMVRAKNSIKDIWFGSKIGKLNQGRTNYCFPAGTLVRMEDGTNKPIEDVRVTERVLTAEGNIRRVVSTIVHDVSEPIYKMLLWGHSHLRATSEHPILTKRGYVPISQLQIGDKVAIPKYQPASVSMIATGDFLYEKNYAPQAKRKYREYSRDGKVESSYTKCIPGKTAVRISRHPVPDFIHLTPEFGRVAGFYLAEGHTGPGAVYFSFNVTEADTHAAECAEKIRASLGCETHTRIRNNVCQVTIYGALWAKLFDAMFSRGSAGKRLCAEMASGPKEFLENVLSGWMDGDRQRGMAAVSVSRELALNMFDIANACGLLPIFSTHTAAKVGKDGIQRKHSWKVGWTETKTNHGTEQDDKYLWRSVRGLEQEEFSGTVFNLSVEGDNSYVAEGIGVHNCWAFASVNALMLQRAVEGKPFVHLSPSSIAGPITGYRNIGGYVEEALDWMIKKGVASEEYVPQTTLSRSDYKVGWQANAELHKVSGWEDVGRNKQRQITKLLNRKPLSCAFMFMMHAMAVVNVTDDNPRLPANNPNRYGLEPLNSWGDGIIKLEGSRAIADNCYAVTQASFAGVV